MTNVPKVRFKEFIDTWEQRKLGELYKINNERNKNLIGYDKTFSIATMTYKDEGNGAADSSLSNYKVLRIGDIAFEGHTNKEFKYGRFVANDVGEGIMSPRFSTLRPINDMPVSFWKYYIHYEPIMRNILICSTKAGTMMNELVAKDFFDQEIMVPCIEEQRKIGQYLEELDNLITLHQRKCDETKELKSFMLQKLFPKNGESYPEVRFEGFTDAWEQRKFGEIVDFLDNLRKPLKESDRESGPYPYYGASGIVDYVADYIFDEELILLSEDGANITDRNYPVCFLASGKYWVNNHAHVLKAHEKMDNNFICMSMERKDYGNYNTGMAMPKLNKETCYNIPVDCPSFEEQEKIGDYFRNLDNLITLHQHKCDELKKIKRYMLQNMFV